MSSATGISKIEISDTERDCCSRHKANLADLCVHFDDTTAPPMLHSIVHLDLAPKKQAHLPQKTYTQPLRSRRHSNSPSAFDTKGYFGGALAKTLMTLGATWMGQKKGRKGV